MSKSNGSVTSVVSHASAWQGPIPSPADLEAFRKILPDAPERIFTMAEAEAAMRRDVTVRNAESENRRKESEVEKYHSDVRRGQWCAFAVLALAIAGATACAYFRCEKIGITIAGMGFVGIVSNFIWKKK